MTRFIDIFAVAILVLFFLLGLLGNRQGEGQLFLQVVVAAVGVMALGWLANQLKVAVAGSISDWRRISVAQAKMAIIANEDDAETLDIAAGLEALERKNYRTAAAAFWFDAEAGGSVGQYYLSRLFRRGHGVPHSREEAIKWLRRSAEQGLVEAQAELGDAYLTGWRGTIHKDYAEALDWLAKAADKGNDYACNRIGLMFEKGLGVRRDFPESANWYRRSAERGDWRGQHGLGRLYLHGKGLSRDMVQAYVWLRLGLEGAHGAGASTNAVSRDLSEAQGRMTPGQLSESRWLVGQWEDRINQPEQEDRREQRSIRRRQRRALAVPIVDRIRAEIARAIESERADSQDARSDAVKPVESDAPAEAARSAAETADRSRIDRRRRVETAAKQAEEKVEEAEKASARLARALRRKGRKNEDSDVRAGDAPGRDESAAVSKEEARKNMQRMAQDRMATRRRRRAAPPEADAEQPVPEQVGAPVADAPIQRSGRGRRNADPVRAKAEEMMANLGRRRGSRRRGGGNGSGDNGSGDNGRGAPERSGREGRAARRGR